MGTLFRLLTLILCVELIVSPIQPNLSLMTNVAFATDCPTGFQFDSNLNRCLTKDETTKVMNATQSCNGDVECYKNNAKAAFVANGNPGNKKDLGFVSTIAQAGAVAGPVTIAALALSSKANLCLSTSHYALIAGSLALVVGENWANLQHKNRLEKIKEDWGKIVNPEDAKGDKDKIREKNITAQGEAFEMLAKSEDSLVTASKFKKNLFMIAGIAYGVSAGLAAWEIIKEKMLVGKTVTAATTAQASCALVKGPESAAQITATTTGITTANTNAPLTIEDITAGSAVTSFSGATAAAASAKLAVGAITIALAAANAATPVAETEVARLTAQLALANTCLANTEALVASATAMKVNKVEITCTAGAAAQVKQEKQSLYAYYTEKSEEFNLKADIQAKYNLVHSKDFASFFVNQKAMRVEHYASLDDFEKMNDQLKDVEFEDNSFFEEVKRQSIALIDRVNPLPVAHAQEVDTNGAAAYREVKGKGIQWGAMAIGGIVAALAVVKMEQAEKLILARGRLWYSGIMGGMSLIMMNHAGSQAEASQKRADLLRKMKEEFNTASGAVYACKSEDRNDPAKPECYCYTPDNGRNTNRTNSQICQKLWTGVNTKPTNYGPGNTASNRVCVNNQRQTDAKCDCKKTNTCMKVSLKGMSGFNPGSFSMLSAGTGTVNGLLNGSSDAASIDPASLANQAANIKNLNDSLAKNPAVAAAMKNKSKEEKKIMDSLTKASAGMPASSMMGNSSSSAMPSNPGDAARMLDKELEYEAPAPVKIDGGNDLAMPSNNEPKENLEFGMNQDDLANQETQVAEVMKQDLDYGGNDTNNDSKANIFEVLSQRYQRSGMKRLFEEPAAAPTAAQPATAETIQK